LSRDSAIEKPNKKFEQEVLQILTTNDKNFIVDEDTIRNIHYGVLFNPAEIKLIMKTQNEYKQMIITIEIQNQELLD
jgi:hypothetical protein